MLFKHILFAAGALTLASAQGAENAQQGGQGGQGGQMSAQMGGQMASMTGAMGAQGTKGAKGGKGGKKGGAQVPADLSGGFKVEEITLKVHFGGKEGKKKGGKKNGTMSAMPGQETGGKGKKGGKGEGEKGGMGEMSGMAGMTATESAMGAMQTDGKKGGKGKKGKGDGMSMKKMMQQPTFSLGKANGTSMQSKWVILMVDVTSPTNRMLHYVHSDYQMTGKGKTIESKTPPQMAYKAPGTLGDMGGKRQYAFLMYQQNGTFPAQGMPQPGQAVDMPQFVQQNGLQKAVAGKAVDVNAQANGTSTTGAGAPAATSGGADGSKAATGAGNTLRTNVAAAGALGAVVALVMTAL